MQTPWSTSPVGLTGRTVVLFAEGSEEAGARGITAAIGAEVDDTRSAPDGMLTGKAIERGRALLVSEPGVAVIDARPEQLEALSAAERDAVLAIEPERTVYAQADPGPPRLPSPAAGALSPDYLRGFRDAADAVLRAGALARGPGLDSPPEAGPPAPVDESQATWGLQAAGVFIRQGFVSQHDRVKNTLEFVAIFIHHVKVSYSSAPVCNLWVRFSFVADISGLHRCDVHHHPGNPALDQIKI